VLNEWLRSWFDGGLHVVGNNPPMLFPKANLAYGQGPAVQPLHTFVGDADAEIRTVVLPRMEVQESNDTVLYSGKLVTSYVLFNFWVSAKEPGAGRSELIAQRIGQCLKAVLTNPASRYALAEKGITHLQAHAPQWLQNTDYAKRLVSCGATIQYPVLFGDVVVDPPSGAVVPGVTTDNESVSADNSAVTADVQ